MINNYQKLFKMRKKQLLAHNPDMEKKYNCAGVYSISINEQLVYIGKAKNMLKRVIEHILCTEYNYPVENKYIVLKDANSNHHKIQFDVMYYATSTNPIEIEREIGEKEGELIRQYLPALNYQIPKKENYKSFSVNKKALTITLQDIFLGKEG